MDVITCARPKSAGNLANILSRTVPRYNRVVIEWYTLHYLIVYLLCVHELISRAAINSFRSILRLQ